MQKLKKNIAALEILRVSTGLGEVLGRTAKHQHRLSTLENATCMPAGTKMPAEVFQSARVNSYMSS
jgi:hypothetical protein